MSDAKLKQCQGRKCEAQLPAGELIPVDVGGLVGHFCMSCYVTGNAAETLVDWADAAEFDRAERIER